MEQNQKPLFVIDPYPTVDWPVIVKLAADGGSFEEYQFTAKIRVLSPSEYEALSAVKAGDSEPTWQEILSDNARKFSELVVGWDGPTDPDGNAVPFTPEVLAAQVIGPHGLALSAGLWKAVNEIRFGERLKNSVPLPGAG